MEESNEEDVRALFESLQGDVSEDQWELYKELKRVGEGLICSDGSDLSQSEDEDTASFIDQASTSKEADISKGMDRMEIAEDSSPSSDDEAKKPTAPWEENLTVKYLDGEITFDEFANIMEKHNIDDDKETTDIAQTSDAGDVTDSSSKKEVSDKETTAGDKFEEEFQTFKKKRKMKRRGQLPKDLQGLMGEANLCFVRGEREDAVKMCMEVIRLAPRAAEPFQTLGMIYDEMGDMEKAFQFSLIGAYLNPSDVEEWVKLAQMSVERENIKMAIICYTNAIKYDNKNINLLWERCTLYEQLGEKKNALRGYEAILNHLEVDQGETCMQFCREIAKIHNENGDIASAIKVMEKTGIKCSEFFTSEDVNILVELQITQKMFIQAVQCIVRHCGVTFENVTGDITEESLSNSTDCLVPEALPIDIQAKLAVCLINLKQFHLVTNVSNPIFLEDPETMGDLFLDIAEAYMAVENFMEALTIFEILVISKNYNLAAVWLRHSECLNSLGRLEEASMSYHKVIEMAPLHFEARAVLAGILLKLDKTLEAIEVLNQDYVEGQSEGLIIDAKILMKQCDLLYKNGKWSEFVPRAKLMLTCHCYPVTTPLEYTICLNNLTCKRRMEALKDIADSIDCSKGHPEFTNKDLDYEELWAFYQKTWKKFYELQKFEDLVVISIRQMTNKLFYQCQTLIKDIEFMAFLACYYARHADRAYSLIKNFAIKDIKQNRIWNIFSQIVTLNQDVRHTRFCLRLMLKNQDHKALSLLNGHSAMIVGSYKHALGEYMHLFNEYSDDPLLTFCIGITFAHLAIQKFTTKKSVLFGQALAFLSRYWDLRGDCQEVYYNMGRAMHGLGLLSFATYFYKKGLLLPPADGNRMGTLDLSRELSYNLALIYQSSGSNDLARYYLQRYCIV